MVDGWRQEYVKRIVFASFKRGAKHGSRGDVLELVFLEDLEFLQAVALRANEFLEVAEVVGYYRADRGVVFEDCHKGTG